MRGGTQSVAAAARMVSNVHLIKPSCPFFDVLIKLSSYLLNMAYVESSWLLSLGTLITVTILYVAGLVIYRLYFSPLAQFPGPKLAAATGWYEFYYDIVKDGLFFKKIQNLHEQYGMCTC